MPKGKLPDGGASRRVDSRGDSICIPSASNDAGVKRCTATSGCGLNIGSLGAFEPMVSVGLTEH